MMHVTAFLTFFAVLIISPIILAGIFNTYYGARYRLPFVPSRQKAISTMLELASLRSDELVLDLGSGTGAVLIAAGRRGAHAIGIEINPFLVWFTRLRARFAGLSHCITVIRGDMFSMEIPQADIVVMYLPSKKTEDLKGKLVQNLPRHARIVTHGFSMSGWMQRAGTTDIHVYRVSDIV